MLYDPKEIDLSEKYLSKILLKLKGQSCLIGGWATHTLVNGNFQQNTGLDYIGSRDIDVGFHVDETWNTSQLKNSDLSDTITLIKEMGFHPFSFRFVKNFEVETGRELSEEESKKYPLHEIFQLFFDPIVDKIHPEMRKTFGFDPIDEPFLSLIFTKNLSTFTNVDGVKTRIPKPHVLLGMKFNSVQIRDKEHKRIKDIADIYAILWYSDLGFGIIKKNLFQIYPEQKVREIVTNFKKEEISQVSDAIGINEAEINRVFLEIR